MSLLPFWALNVVVALLSMKDQKALGFYLNILFVFWKLMKVFRGLERHDSERLITEFSFFWMNYPFNMFKNAKASSPWEQTLLQTPG